MKRNTRQTIQTIALLLAVIAAMVFIDEDYLLPGCWVALAIGVGAVFAIKAWKKHLHGIGTLDQGGQREFLDEVGMAFAMVGLVAFLILLGVYTD